MNLLNMPHKMYLKIFEMPMGFAHTAEEDREYLKSFPEPKNDFERSYYQYLCQKWNCKSKFKWILMNIVCGLMILPMQIQFYYAGKKKTKKSKQYDFVMIKDFIKGGYLPKSNTVFTNERVKCLEAEDYGKGALTKKDIHFLKNIWRMYPGSFYFYFKCMCRIASYSLIIKEYSPKHLYVSAEYSFTSSILTTYCYSKGVIHINVMHGDKIFDLTDAFSHFHVFYVWEDFYVELFYKLRANKTKYIIYRQNFPEFTPKHNPGKCVYYLQIHKRTQLEKIKKSLDRTGLDYKVRPHPLHLNKTIEEVFGKEHIEDPQKVNIWDSLRDAGYVISVASTVLLQAFWNRLPIIIDDISNSDYSKELEFRDYILFEKKYKLLSELEKN